MTEQATTEVPELPASAVPIEQLAQDQRPPDHLIIGALSQELQRINDNRVYLLAENAHLRNQLDQVTQLLRTVAPDTLASVAEPHGHDHPHPH